jgi:hypothetical protein
VSAHGYRTQKFILLRTFDRGFDSHAYDTHFELLPPEAEADALGRAVITALNASRYQTRDEYQARVQRVRERGKEYEDELRARFGFRNRTALYTRMTCCMIFRHRDHLEFAPTNRMRQRLENYSALSGQEVLVPVMEGQPLTGNEHVMGQALLESFRRCTIGKPDWWGQP